MYTVFRRREPHRFRYSLVAFSLCQRVEYIAVRRFKRCMPQLLTNEIHGNAFCIKSAGVGLPYLVKTLRFKAVPLCVL